MAKLIFNDQNFEEEVLKSEIPVLVDFWAPWCQPCLMMAPILEELAEDKSLEGKIKIGALNVDENPQTASRFGIMSIPTIIIFQKGIIVDQIIGLQAKENLLARINNIIMNKEVKK